MPLHRAVLADALRPLESDRDLDPLLEAIGERRLVLLGEASHGTHEFYAWRDRLSRRLIAERGFSFIAVEGDWPDSYRLNQFVKGLSVKGRSGHHNAVQALHGFDRWPTWMWANHEVSALLEWLRQHNEALPDDERAGFYGLDVYSLWDSLGRVLGYLEAREHEHRDGTALAAAREAFRCFEPYGADPLEYARAAAFVPVSCEDEVVTLLGEVLGQAAQQEEHAEDRFSLEQNAHAAAAAELYYRTMIRGGRESWNIRDTHMVDTLDRLLALHGEDSKAIVWAHNTHVGDARATPMGPAGMCNVGQLVRDRHGPDNTYIVGFAAHRGSVIAGAYWGAPMERMAVPPALEGSLEDKLHRAVGRDGLLLLDEVAKDLPRAIDHRAIGVVYSPIYDRLQNYVPSRVAERYDALVYLEQTRALVPLGLPQRPPREPPETYPTAV